MRQRAKAATGLVAVCAALLGSGAAAAAKESQRREIRDLHYGDVLFQFFQDDYFDAVVRLEAARDFGRLPNHAADAELLAGGMYLSLGLHAEADRIFNRLLAGSVDPSVADRAFFYLARIGYQRGHYQQAARNIAQIRGPLPGELEPERRLLESNVLMALGRYAEAAAALRVWDDESSWAAFARFNLGVALVRSGDSVQGRMLLESVGGAPAVSEEQRSLRDRANLALGFALLQERSGHAAAAALSRVRLDGPFTNRALLGLGWAEADAQRPDRALVPWLALRDRPLLDSSVQESLLAVPYAYARLASNGQAAQHYRQAVQSYLRESGRIDESIAAIERGGFLEAILASSPRGGDVGWFWQLEQIPDAPHTRYLYHLLASHEFQEGLKNYRDLRIMQVNLERWQQSLDSFDDMIAARTRASAEREPRKADTLARTDVEALAARQAGLAARVAAIESARDVAALASGDEARQWRTLQGIEQRFSALPPGPGRDSLADRARMLRGALTWQMDAQYKRRLQLVKRGLAEIDAQLGEARGRVGLVHEASTQAPLDTTGFAARIAELRSRIARIGPGIDAATRAQESVLAKLAVHELAAQKKRLASYATQAQFALAAIYDGAAAKVAP
jgi:tetratricopeptide (TPR) repeat protein